jgi:hypothetical protein
MQFDEYYLEIGDFFAKWFPDGITQTAAEAAARALERELEPLRVNFEVKAGAPTEFRMAIHKDDQLKLLTWVREQKMAVTELPKVRGFA